MNAARDLLHERSYADVSVEDITSRAGVSRASFWTYFASKQDVLRALGADTASMGDELAREFRSIAAEASLDQLSEWVSRYLDFLDANGAFISAAYQVSRSDPELAQWLLTSELDGARVVGAGLVDLHGGTTPDVVDPTIEGLGVLCMLELIWHRRRVSKIPIDETRLAHSLAHLIRAGRSS